MKGMCINLKMKHSVSEINNYSLFMYIVSLMLYLLIKELVMFDYSFLCIKLYCFFDCMYIGILLEMYNSIITMLATHVIFV